MNEHGSDDGRRLKHRPDNRDQHQSGHNRADSQRRSAPGLGKLLSFEPAFAT